MAFRNLTRVDTSMIHRDTKDSSRFPEGVFRGSGRLSASCSPRAGRTLRVNGAKVKSCRASTLTGRFAPAKSLHSPTSVIQTRALPGRGQGRELGLQAFLV